MQMSDKDNKPRRGMAALVAISSLAVAAVAASLFWLQLSTYEDSLVDVFAQQQDQYVQLAVDQLDKAGKPDEKSFESVIESITGSDSQYWTLTRDDDLVFVKDVAQTNRYRGLSDATYFETGSARSFVASLEKGRVSHAVIDIDGRAFIASGSCFAIGKESFNICLLTGKSVVMDSNDYLTAKINLATTFGIALALFVVLAIALGLLNDRKSRQLARSESQCHELRSKIEQLGDKMLNRDIDVSAEACSAQSETEERAAKGSATAAVTAAASTAVRPHLNAQQRAKLIDGGVHIYRFKFYLNASHYVFFNGNQGETHPHTWEFALKLRVRNHNTLVQFSTYESALEEVFSPYQNKTINECEPFDILLPTLENLVEIFGTRLLHVADELDADLLEIEGSETPTRSYMVSYER